jgi:hypothetical protein
MKSAAQFVSQEPSSSPSAEGRRKFFQRDPSSASPDGNGLSLFFSLPLGEKDAQCQMTAKKRARERLRVRATRRFARLVAFTFVVMFSVVTRADIPWPEVVRRLADANEKLARRPQGHNGEYFVVCTLYYTPKESGFTTERGFDATMVTKPGLRGRKYPRDFLASVRKEGFGRMREPVNGCPYIRYNGGSSYTFSKHVVGRGTAPLVPRFSAAARRGQSGLGDGKVIETPASDVQRIFGSTTWKIVDTGGGLRRWQIDLYWGEDEPLGPGRFMARPSGTTFEYAYSEAKVR